MKSWKKTSEALVYDGYRKVLRRTFELPDSKTTDFDVIKSSGGAAILTLTENNKIICFKQFRPGPEEILFELPGGGIEEGEDPLVTMKRELLEETGYEADIAYIGNYCRDAYITGRWHMFIGTHATCVAEPTLEPTEFGELVLLTVEEFKEKLFAGDMSDTTLGYAGLYRLGLL